jgi:hypothetical protein
LDGLQKGELGENVLAKRWTRRRKEWCLELFQSRNLVSEVNDGTGVIG